MRWSRMILAAEAASAPESSTTGTWRMWCRAMSDSASGRLCVGPSVNTARGIRCETRSSCA